MLNKIDNNNNNINDDDNNDNKIIKWEIDRTGLNIKTR